MTVTDIPVVGSAAPKVSGFCPMGCGRSLVLEAAGVVRCANLACPRPLAVFQLLGDAEVDHVVEIRPGDYTLLHPLRERLGQALMSCPLQQRMNAMRKPPLPPGRYRAYLPEGDDEIDWDPLPSVPPPNPWLTAGGDR